MAEKETDIDESKRNYWISLRYFVVVLLLLPIVIGVVVLMAKIAFVEKEHWLKVAESRKKPSVILSPNRGNIYSSDGKLMVTSSLRYDLFMDFQAGSFLKDTFLQSKDNGVDSLAFYLSRKFRDRSAASYKTHLMRGLNEKKRNYRIYAEKVSYADLLEIRQFPFFRCGNSNKTGLKAEETIKRVKLFGSLASRTIGDIIVKKDSQGKDSLYIGDHGLELRYDSLLRGQPGLSTTIKVGEKWTNVTELEPVNGLDIQTTIDTQIQDFTEKALLDKLKEIDAELGVAIVMDVRTGEIKAISNMVRTPPGTYTEKKNHAVADMIEPGSTFKVASMMVALEDKICSPDSIIDTGNGIFHYPYRSPKYSPITDHNANKGGFGKLSVDQTLVQSSNVGLSKLILSGYEKNPAKFVEGLNRTGINAELKLEIQGAGQARIITPESSQWSVTTLTRMSYGYEVLIPPINTLTFFNAIANDGKMIHPVFTKEIRKDGKTVKRFSAETLRPSICSQETLKLIREMLVNVVEEGTGKAFRSDAVRFAGKTGTAQIVTGGGYSSAHHNLSFCGYFPAERPQYSCIVMIRRPRIGEPTSAMPGSVFKTIAEKIHSHQTSIEVRTMRSDLADNKIPSIKNGDTKALRNVLDELKIKNNARQIKSEYAQYEHHPENGQIELQELTVQGGQVPNVVGMGAKDAVYILEKSGLRVSVAGRGQVVSQSVAAGQNAVKGQTVSIVLR